MKLTDLIWITPVLVLLPFVLTSLAIYLLIVAICAAIEHYRAVADPREEM